MKGGLPHLAPRWGLIIFRSYIASSRVAPLRPFALLGCYEGHTSPLFQIFVNAGWPATRSTPKGVIYFSELYSVLAGRPTPPLRFARVLRGAHFAPLSDFL